MNDRNRTAVLALLLCGLVLGGFAERVLSQCSPVDYQKSFQQVYRLDKFFLEGVADLTGDGRPDAYGYQRLSFGFRNLVVVPNNGTGGFGDPVVVSGDFPVGEQFGTIESRLLGNVIVGDVNGDGRLDMVVRSNYSPKSVHTMINNGNGTFSQVAIPRTVFDNERVIQIADLDNDGRGDLITANVHPTVNADSGILNGLYYRLRSASGAFGDQVQLSSDGSTSPVLLDYNNDTRIDIVLSYYGPDNRFYYKILTNQGSGLFNTGPPVSADYFSVFGTADLNSDGRPDLVANGTSETVVLTNNGNGGFDRANYPNALPTQTLSWYHRMAIVDYNGDGHKDIIDSVTIPASFSYPESARRFYSVFINNGVGGFTRSDFFRPFQGVPADVNGDGRSDQVIFSNSTAFGSRVLNAANEPGIIVRQGVCQPSAATGQVSLLDFAGDRISDLATWNPATGVWRYSSNFAVNSTPWGLGSLGDIPTPGDFDGDGRSDLAVYRNSTGVWWYLRSSDNTWAAVRYGLPGDLPAAADYDGGGKTDIAVYRRSDGTWYFLSTETQQTSAIRFGISEDVPVQQDYDGDGKFDIAVYRPSTGFWWYLRSSDGGLRSINWGLSTDVPVPADYDSDGKADLAVFRQGSWFILRSFDSAYIPLQFGTTGDLPMAVDSNGDGLIEPGVYRPSNFTWYALAQENLSGAFGTFGSNAEVPIRMLLRNN